MDALYPRQRPARVTIRTAQGDLTAFAPEASGSPDIPVTDAAITDKFLSLVAPHSPTAQAWCDALWQIGTAPSAAPLLIGDLP